ncbi:hypothetical protein L207DRAFT_25274 [Hyaloscypha variabilis F]|uniref:Uncharacterized protein n=1 Tax=Hyaloscypha variabilis (strain UAMH 11265 / GT02V1 / F) TaxID=1149755 RepID=A0A2J6RMF1_HYAVF|nr:hypothetical protein L207DRAFT_25274 [Hyaloscypha variabilis F]
MASRQARKSQPAMPSSESDGEDSQQSSQEADMNVFKAAQSVVSTFRSRRESKRKAIEGSLKKGVEDINAKLDAHFEARKSRVQKLQNAQWEKLEALNKRREAIEAQINSSMRAIEAQTINISSELGATYDGRNEEIADASSPRN